MEGKAVFTCGRGGTGGFKVDPWGLDTGAASVASEVFRADGLFPALDGSFCGGGWIPETNLRFKTGDMAPRGVIESVVGVRLGLGLKGCASSLNSVCTLTSLAKSSNSESRSLFSVSTGNPAASSS